MKKKILFLLLLSIGTTVFAQKIKYNDVKNDFSTKDYHKIIQNPKYSPIAAGFLNLRFPSLGYFYIGETNRGLAVLSSEAIIVALLLNNASNGLTNGVNDFFSIIPSNNPSVKTQKKENIIPTEVLIPLGLAIHIWSVFDVVKVAKIKNLAYQKQSLSLKLEPNVEVLDKGGDFGSNTYGLKLTYSF